VKLTAIRGFRSRERLLYQAVEAGRVVPCEGAEVPAELVRALATTERLPSGRPPHAVRLQDAQITGSLNLESVTLVCPLSLEDCQFGQPVTLDEAQAPTVRLNKCRLPALHARQLETRGDLALDEIETQQVVLAGARIGGSLAMREAKLSPRSGLALDGSRLQVSLDMHCQDLQSSGEVRLAGAQIAGALWLSGAELENAHGPALGGDGLRIEGGMFGRPRFVACGEVRLVGAHIGTALSLDGAQLINPTGSALSADRLQVDGAMFCQAGFASLGEISLAGAHIFGQFSLDGARLSNPGRLALVCDRLEVDASVFCREGFRARGEVRLRNAHVAGTLSFGDARLANIRGPALNGDGLHVDGALLCRGMRARGQIRLVGGRVGTDLAFADAELGAPDNDEPLLELSGVETAALWLPTSQSSGVIDLTGARVGTLSDPVWPSTAKTKRRPYRPRLTGFTYESLAPGTDDLAARLDWIKHAEGGFSPHAYDQLEAALRRAGREKDAREVAIAKRRRRRKKLPRHAAAWDTFVDVTVGYGYRTWRSAYALLGVIVVGWLVFASASWDHLRATKPDRELPDFEPWLYSLDSVLPVLNLGQEAAWTPTGAAQNWYVFSVVAGWILATAMIAAVTAGLARK